MRESGGYNNELQKSDVCSDYSGDDVVLFGIVHQIDDAYGNVRYEVFPDFLSRCEIVADDKVLFPPVYRLFDRLFRNPELILVSAIVLAFINVAQIAPAGPIQLFLGAWNDFLSVVFLF